MLFHSILLVLVSSFTEVQKERKLSTVEEVQISWFFFPWDCKTLHARDSLLYFVFLQGTFLLDSIWWQMMINMELIQSLVGCLFQHSFWML